MGSILGSFMTPLMADMISIDNLMLFYLFTTAGGALALKGMEKEFPNRVFHKDGKEEPVPHKSIIETFRRIPELVKHSSLIKILILLHLLPNVVIPIINFQFRYAIDQSYATEGGVLDFFGYFMGILNSLNLIILLFVGRIFKQWGLPAALMFHPANYLLAFLGLLVRFDIFTAIYARLSTSILRTTFNKPARAALFGLLPKEDRDLVRSFLRGGVVRVGIVAGSGLALFSEAFMHPRYLSIVAALFVVGWIITTYVLKEGYLDLVLSLISTSATDPEALRALKVRQIFKGRAVQGKLLNNLLSSRGRESLWYARLLRILDAEELDACILRVLEKQDYETAIGLLSLLRTRAGQKTLHLLNDLVDPSKPELTIAVARAGNRFPKEAAKDLNLEVLDKSKMPEVQAYAIAGLYPSEPEKYRELVETWLKTEDISHRKAGIIAAGRSGDA